MLKLDDAPRRLLIELTASQDTTLAELSRGMGRNHAYLQQFVMRGSPRELPEFAREFLGQRFGVNPDSFRLTPRQTPPKVPLQVMRDSTNAPDISAMPLNVPVYGTAVGGSSGAFQMNGNVVDYVRRPPGIARAQGVFAVYVQGDSMSPWRFPGDPIYINPARPARQGDHVLVELQSERDGEPGAAFVKRLVTVSATSVRLAQYNPVRDDIEIPREQVRQILRIVEWAELLGF